MLSGPGRATDSIERLLRVWARAARAFLGRSSEPPSGLGKLAG
jgi:hypothetical protein